MAELRKASANFLTGFATGWPEDRPDLMILTLTTANGTQDFAMTKEQSVLVAKTIKETAANLKGPKA